MNNKQNVETFFDYLDKTADLLYREYKKSYFESVNEAIHFLLDQTTKETYQEEHMKLLEQYRANVQDVSFEKEEVRKAMQLAMLRGYKHAFQSNELMTPDTIGIFTSYLIQKCYTGMDILQVLDPFIGTGNYLYTVINQLPVNPIVFGVDNDFIKCELSRNMADLLDYEAQMYYQDALSYYGPEVDLILMDLPIQSEEEFYLPYAAINHYMDMLRPKGFLFALIENDFFEQPNSAVFKREIDEKANIFGLIKLPDSMFKTHPKSILILERTNEPTTQEQFLLVDMPSFTNKEEMNRTIAQIEDWFQKRG